MSRGSRVGGPPRALTLKKKLALVPRHPPFFVLFCPLFFAGAAG